MLNCRELVIFREEDADVADETYDEKEESYGYVDTKKQGVPLSTIFAILLPLHCKVG